MESGIKSTYVLITAARNEVAYITGTIKSVLAQTLRPMKWVIISDGSTDGTDEIVRRYASKHDFIDFQRREPDEGNANFASQVFAQRHGYLRLRGKEYKFLGFLDADITFGPSYYEEILKHFEANPRLGIGGGFIYESRKGQFESRQSNGVHSVAGAIQLFRRECYEMIGGIRPLRVGGMDFVADIDARMAGWEVRAFSECAVYHHKSGFTKRGLIREGVRRGIMDYVVGSHPVFELLKCINRFKLRPYFINGLLRMYGYSLAWLRNEERAMEPAAISYLRAWQLNRIKYGLKGIMRTSANRHELRLF